MSYTGIALLSFLFLLWSVSVGQRIAALEKRVDELERRCASNGICS